LCVFKCSYVPVLAVLNALVQCRPLGMRGVPAATRTRGQDAILCRTRDTETQRERQRDREREREREKEREAYTQS